MGVKGLYYLIKCFVCWVHAAVGGSRDSHLLSALSLKALCAKSKDCLREAFYCLPLTAFSIASTVSFILS